MAQEVRLPDGSSTDANDILGPWIDRRDAGKKARRPFEFQWMVNTSFAAGKQHLRYSPHEHRVVERRKDDRDRMLLTMDTLAERCATAEGQISASDLRPELVLSADGGELDEGFAEQINLAYGWGWDEEWKGDRKLLTVLRELVRGTGTAALRCFYDRTKGQIVADQFPHMDGRPLLKPDVRAKAMADTPQKVRMLPLRAGLIVWEFLSGWNLLPPPGVVDPFDFPYDLIVRPVYLPDLVSRYGDKAKAVQESNVRATDYIQSEVDDPVSKTQGAGKLQKHAFVYTGYLRPTAEKPDGETVVFTDDNVLLDFSPRLPYTDQPYGPRPGVTYFRWEILPGRFFGRAFIEKGIDGQKAVNKTINQVDEIIDRGMPVRWVERDSIDSEQVSGAPVAIVEVEPGAALPRDSSGIPVGPWMFQYLDALDSRIEKGMGIHNASLGSNSPGVTAYAALAQQLQADATKFDPIVQEFQLGIADVGRDTYEAMRQWGPQKQLLLAGDDGRLQALEFNATEIPAGFKVRPAKGASLPRSQAAEIQKITDLWNAAVVCGLVVQAAQDWIDWYKRSLDAGMAEELPQRDQSTEQRHKAALENVVMLRTGQPLPVSDYDNVQIHVDEIDTALMDAQQRLELGDPNAAAQVQALAAHREMHLAQAQQQSAIPGAAPQAGLPAAAAGASQAGRA
jgi:hypothetical protein